MQQHVSSVITEGRIIEVIPSMRTDKPSFIILSNKDFDIRVLCSVPNIEPYGMAIRVIGVLKQDNPKDINSPKYIDAHKIMISLEYEENLSSQEEEEKKVVE